MRESESTADAQCRRQPTSWLSQCVALTLILFAWSVLRLPVPGVNEPHYLTKARHYWNPGWIQGGTTPEGWSGDVFLDSSNPHLFFYATIGVLTKFLPLEQAALAGRFIGCLFVAVGWWQLIRALTIPADDEYSAPRWTSLLGPLAIFLLFQSLGNWSGEWVVGGIESKVPAYGLLLYGLGSLLRSGWYRAGVACGLAVSFHPLVGGWGVLAIAGMLLWDWWRNRGNCPAGKTMVFASLLFAACVSMGIIPALQMLLNADPVAARDADYLMVAFRLAHHLDPMVFPLESWRYFGLLLGLWGLLRWSRSASRSQHRWELFVLFALAFALAGVLAAAGPRPMNQMSLLTLRVMVLKFYPFRLIDGVLPIAVALEVWHYCCQRAGELSRRQQGIVVAICLLVITLSTQIQGTDRNPSAMSRTQQQDWQAVCHWVRDNTPRSAILYATNERWAMKWYAERSEYVNYKDCPQDAASLLEWNRRQWIIADWQTAVFSDWQVTREELIELHEQTGITHLLVSRMGPFRIAPIHEQGDFKVYELPTH